MAKNKLRDERFAEREVRLTNDYSKFKTMTGNRGVDKIHVNHLIKLMTSNGNLTDKFPIIITKDGLVIDGQHRLEALKILGWEVGYIVEPDATIETVRNINRGNKNWNWRDTAESYAILGNEEYIWFLKFFDSHELTYSLAMAFCDARMGKRFVAVSSFNNGSLEIKSRSKAELYATQYEDLRRLVDVKNHEFGKALNKIFRSPFYDHERMSLKLSQLGYQLPAKATEVDYRRELERMFNHGYSDENKARLF